MPQHMIEEVFGQGCDLYKLLKCNADATKAQLRKGYYRAALRVHPDKNTNNDIDTTKQFQAISMAYQILQDETLRQEYDETGVIPDSNDADNNDDMTGRDAWKSYFDQIFGKVTTSKIDSFAAKYKCSDEEKRDVLREFKSRKGNLVKMLDFVMLSEPRDAIRWVEDYIRPFYYEKIENNNSSNDTDTTDADKKDAAAWKTTMEKTLTKLQKQVEKENQKQAAAAAAAANDQEDDDDNSMEDEGETETEDEEVETPQKKKQSRKSSSSKKSSSAKKAKPLQAKHAKKSQKTNNTKKNNNNKNQGSSMDDLIAQIQSKHRGGGGSSSNAWADLGARYGVMANEEEDDPLNDDELAKIQAGLGNKKKSKGKR